METVLLILAILLIVVGMIGSVLPVLPGPPLAFVGIILTQVFTDYQLAPFVFWSFGVMMVLITIGDFLLPGLLVKIGKGSKNATQGANLGLLIGLFLGPPGLIIGPFFGAMFGEMTTGKSFSDSFKPAILAFLGFATGVLLKFGYSLLLLFWLLFLILFR